MTFDTLKQAYSKEHLFIVEIEQDYCDLVSGTSPCTATETGDAKCYNTIVTCNDVPNFDQVTKTYRFCENTSPHPAGLDAIPSLVSVSIAPATIDLQGGLGVRSNVSLTFNDQPSADIGVDPYLTDRTYIASDQGTFWTKWRARNPYYQGRSIKVLSGYLVDGVFDAANFTTRYYIIDSLTVSGGKCSIVGKDPLKLADSIKAKAPAASNGLISGSLTAVATSITLTPSGIGSEYPSTGYVRVKGEVMEVTARASDVLTVVRGQYNTTAVAHSANDTVQLCLEYDAQQVDDIVADLLTTYAGIDSAFIPTASWAAEADTYLTGLLSTLITEPVGVATLLKELGEQAPHSLYWDERAQEVQFLAVKPPPEDGANCLDMDSNLLADSLSVKDEESLRVSTVIVYFGQVDPTKKLDETNNYAQVYARVNTDGIARYGSDRVKTIYSRWITNVNKTAALLLAERLGRRFGFAPRSVTFSLDPKDGDLWAGDTIGICHRDMVDPAGVPAEVAFQVISAKEGDARYDYKGIEFDYDAAVDSDEGAGDIGFDLITIGADQTNLNIRTVYDSLFPTPDASTVCKIVIESGVQVGSSSNTTAGMDTGIWPAGATVTIENRGYIVGYGGRLGSGVGAGSFNGSDGGLALDVNNDVTIDNFGIIGGGGGGGGTLGFFSDIDGLSYRARGGNGAGYLRGSDATVTTGDAGDSVTAPDGTYYGGDGGDLGQAGADSDGYYGGDEGLGGAAGDAINENGYTVTYSTAGDIRGTIA